MFSFLPNHFFIKFLTDYVCQQEVFVTSQSLLANDLKQIIPFATKMEFSKFMQNISNSFNNIDLGDGWRDNSLVTKVFGPAKTKKRFVKKGNILRDSDKDDENLDSDPIVLSLVLIYLKKSCLFLKTWRWMMS